MSNSIVRCDLCLFYEPKTPNGDLGVCRRHAPNPVLSPDQVDDKPNVIWPQVTHSDFCGDGIPGETAEFPKADKWSDEELAKMEAISSNKTPAKLNRIAKTLGQ